MGGQYDDFDYHKCGFDFKTIKSFLEEAGFSSIQKYEWKEFLLEEYDDYSHCYHPHMDFENGTLVSLNIIAVKSL